MRPPGPDLPLVIIAHEDWQCGCVDDFFCVMREPRHQRQHAILQEFMGWVFEKSLVDLGLDERCREEVSSLVLRCTLLGRAVAILSQAPVVWLV